MIGVCKSNETIFQFGFVLCITCKLKSLELGRIVVLNTG